MKLRFAIIALMACSVSALAATSVPDPKPDTSEESIFGAVLQPSDMDTQTFVIEAVNYDAGIVLVQAPDDVPATEDNRFTALFAKANEAFNNSIYVPELDRLCRRIEYELLCIDRLMIKVYEGNKFRLEPTPAAWLKPDNPKSNFFHN